MSETEVQSLRAFVEGLGWTGKDLGDAAGISQALACMAMRGGRVGPKSLSLIAAALSGRYGERLSVSQVQAMMDVAAKEGAQA